MPAVTSSGRKGFDLLEIAKGNVPGHSSVIIRGHNPSQTASSGFVDVAEFGNLTYLASEETMNVVSTHTDDDGAPAGDGLKNLLISGVDNTGAAVSEVVVMNGTDAVTTTQAFLRVNSMQGLTVGSTGWNVGSVTATSSSGATVHCEMDATESLSQNSHYTIALGVTAFLVQIELNSAKISGGQSPEVEFKGYARIAGAGAAWLQLFDKKMDTDATDEIDLALPIPTRIPARTDIRFRADTDQDTTECRTRMYLVLVED